MKHLELVRTNGTGRPTTQRLKAGQRISKGVVTVVTRSGRVFKGRVLGSFKDDHGHRMAVISNLRPSR